MTQIIIPAIITSSPLNLEKLSTLINAGVFDLKSGKVEINIHNGQIQNIHINQMTYKREKDTI